MAFTLRMATLAAVVAVPLGIAATSYTLTESPETPKVPPEVKLGATPRPGVESGSPGAGAGGAASPAATSPGTTASATPVPGSSSPSAVPPAVAHPPGTAPAGPAPVRPPGAKPGTGAGPAGTPTDAVVPGPPAAGGDDDDDDFGDDAVDEN
ncbi:hypothetical protein ACF1G0_02650 [Streptomyces sp. NPDC013953]|uniref:hypothetical protein n=1 Tax=Streptomyces sp. NPDC013953 TaxID=3364868 RepID=UPI0036FE15BA